MACTKFVTYLVCIRYFQNPFDSFLLSTPVVILRNEVTKNLF